MNTSARIYIAGHLGMVGSGIVRALQRSGFHHLITRTRNELDLRNNAEVNRFFSETKPDYVFMAAAKVGGILANSSFPADFIYDNLAIQTNVIHQSYLHGVRKLLFLGSSCIYPRHAPQPISEDSLLTSCLEPSNEWYAIAKIAGIKMCQAYRKQFNCNFVAAMPTNLYGPHDNFDLNTSHVVPALIRKFHEAAETGASPTLWGTGRARREFLHVDDCAEGCVFLMNEYDGSNPVNVGTGSDISIEELASLVGGVTGYRGEVRWDADKPDGTPRKLLDCSRIHAMGWRHEIDLQKGLEMTYDWYRNDHLRVSLGYEKGKASV